MKLATLGARLGAFHLRFPCFSPLCLLLVGFFALASFLGVAWPGAGRGGRKTKKQVKRTTEALGWPQGSRFCASHGGPWVAPRRPLCQPRRPLGPPKRPWGGPKEALAPAKEALWVAPRRPLGQPRKPLGPPTRPLGGPHGCPWVSQGGPWVAHCVSPGGPWVAPKKLLGQPRRPLGQPRRPLVAPRRPLCQPRKPLCQPMRPLCQPKMPLGGPKDVLVPAKEAIGWSQGCLCVAFRNGGILNSLEPRGVKLATLGARLVVFPCLCSLFFPPCSLLFGFFALAAFGGWEPSLPIGADYIHPSRIP